MKFAIVFVVGGEVVEGPDGLSKAEAKRLKAHYEHPRHNRTQWGATTVNVVPMAA